ncbi:transcriptional regulator/antitoxin, MazE [Candidatus Poribacteria bacterium]|nr:transcriptional regulator/antitoxin, MazE [Candidatus Poribacteria bacterium]
MNIKIQNLEGKDGICVSKNLLDSAQIKADEEVQVTIQNGRIIVESAAKAIKRIKLRELVSKMPKDYKPTELDWGKPVGKEVW